MYFIDVEPVFGNVFVLDIKSHVNNNQKSSVTLWQAIKVVESWIWPLKQGSFTQMCHVTIVLTDLQLSGNSSFAPVSKVNLSLVVFCHHLYKLLRQDSMLWKSKLHKTYLNEDKGLPTCCI